MDGRRRFSEREFDPRWAADYDPEPGIRRPPGGGLRPVDSEQSRPVRRAKTPKLKYDDLKVA